MEVFERLILIKGKLLKALQKELKSHVSYTIQGFKWANPNVNLIFQSVHKV